MTDAAHCSACGSDELRIEPTTGAVDCVSCGEETTPAVLQEAEPRRTVGELASTLAQRLEALPSSTYLRPPLVGASSERLREHGLALLFGDVRAGELQALCRRYLMLAPKTEQKS